MSGWMVGEWGGDGSELASALLNLHQDRWPLGQLVLWTAVYGLRVVKHPQTTSCIAAQSPVLALLALP